MSQMQLIGRLPAGKKWKEKFYPQMILNAENRCTKENGDWFIGILAILMQNVSF